MQIILYKQTLGPFPLSLHNARLYLPQSDYFAFLPDDYYAKAKNFTVDDLLKLLNPLQE
jgi:hypothetical protein